MRKCFQLGTAALCVAGLAGCQHFQSAPLLPQQTASAFDARSLADPQLKVWLEAHLHRPLPEWPVRSWDFDALTLAALFFHPGLDLADAQWQVAQAGVESAAGRPNPTVTLTPGYDLNPAQGVTPWLPLGTLDWPLETAGKRGFRMARAQHLAQAARLDVQTAAWDVRRQLRTNLLELSSARQREQLLSAQQEVLDQISRSLEERLAAGAIARSELTADALLRAKNRVDLSQAQMQVVQARAGVAETVGVPRSALEGLELSFQLDPDALGPAEPEFLDLRRRALQSRSDVLSSIATYAAAQSALQLEVARQYPDIHLGTGYQWDQGEHKWSLGVTLELPVLNRNQGPIAEAQARRLEAAARFNLLQSKVIAEIDRAIGLSQAARQQLTNFNLYLATQKTQLELVQAQWRAGAADRLDVLHAQAELGLLQLAQLDALIQSQQAVGALEDALQPAGIGAILLSDLPRGVTRATRASALDPGNRAPGHPPTREEQHP